MKGDKRQTRAAWALALLITLALVLSLLLPLVGAAQEADEDVPTTEVLAEVPSTGGSRMGPVVQASSRIAAPEPEPEPEVVAGVAPIALQVDKFGIDAPIEIGTVVDGVMLDPSGPWVVSWYEPLGKIGEGGNVVGPAVFWNVRDLVPGDIVRLVGEDGQSYEYAVQWMQQYNVVTDLTPQVIQNDIVGDTGEETLTLITCGGDFDPTTATYNQRWVLRAALI
jgi:hypothetical protein